MNIAIFTNNYLPNSFGVANSVESFRKSFERLGHTVYIFAPKWPGYLDKNPNVFHYPSIDIRIKIRFPLAIPYSWRIRRILKNLDIDVIHSQHPNLLGSTAMRWAARKKIPLIFTWHTRYDLYTGFVPFLPAKLSAGFMIKKAVNFANRSDVVIAPTNSMAAIVKNWGVKKEIIPVATGVEIEQFENADGIGVRERYGVKKDEVLLFVISRLTAEKNMKFLFHSVIKILKNNKKIKFLAAAEGYLRPEMEKAVVEGSVSSQVIFAGHIKDDIKKNYFAASDIFVFASKSETQGMVITEAMYSGLPIVAVDAPGVCDLVENNVSGLLVAEDNFRFREAVEKLVKDKNLRERMGKEGKRIAKEKYTDVACANKLLEVYKKAIEHKKQGDL